MKPTHTVEYITHNEKETQRLGETLARKIEHGVITLSGDLGFGKTTFVQGFAKGLGIKRRIISPTFIIMRTYDIPQTNKNFYHIDLYRINLLQDISGLGLSELLESKESLVLIEWPDRLGDVLPKKRIDIIFDYLNEKERKITISET